MIQAHTEFEGDLDGEAMEMLRQMAEDSNARELASAGAEPGRPAPPANAQEKRRGVKRRSLRAQR